MQKIVQPSLGPFLVQLQMPLAKIIFGLFSVFMFTYAWVYYPIEQGHGGDFIAMLSGRQVDAGYWSGNGMGYGPVFAIYDLILRGISDLVAMRIMYALNLAMLTLAFWVALQRFIPAPRKVEENLAAVFIWLSFYPTFQALRQNNVEITELLFLVLMLKALYDDRQVLAGICLGVAGATKILPLVLVIYFVWRRRFTLAAVSILTVLVLFLFVIWLKGEALFPSLSAWFSVTQVPWAKEFQNNQAISGLVWRAFSQFDLSTRATIETPIILNALAARNLTIGVSIILFGIVALSLVKRVGFMSRKNCDKRLESVEIALVLMSTLLLLPHNHTHYFILISWMYFAGIREWPKSDGTKGQMVFGLLSLSYFLLGMLFIWRFFDPFLYSLGPITGLDLARLASIPFFGALAGLMALLILHGELLSEYQSKRNFDSNSY